MWIVVSRAGMWWRFRLLCFYLYHRSTLTSARCWRGLWRLLIFLICLCNHQCLERDTNLLAVRHFIICGWHKSGAYSSSLIWTWLMQVIWMWQAEGLSVRVPVRIERVLIFEVLVQGGGVIRVLRFSRELNPYDVFPHLFAQGVHPASRRVVTLSSPLYRVKRLMSGPFHVAPSGTLDFVFAWNGLQLRCCQYFPEFQVKGFRRGLGWWRMVSDLYNERSTYNSVVLGIR